ncbi:spermatogenesis-associated protein 6 [Aricia agestis]|uniref:spermatogenesis-associated protein 6 n=1 Tax=Aricia agestis TaxID=91739 RepID=UPI001C207D85|nr:spermatogenesis-associated protein 6 [Aricia agestis]
MPKTVELTIEIEVEKVSCPGVWLCQDGRVSLTVFALGTSYQTCLLPPTFPLTFKDVFYFRKRFKEACAVNNICCLLKDETVYCELVQWSEDCASGECVMLAQYLGSLNDMLFPPNTCSSDGVDLLMRRTKDFPGILSPKIEIATKVRIDEIRGSKVYTDSSPKDATKRDSCSHKSKLNDCETTKHRPVCHSPQYHRLRCRKTNRKSSRTRSKSAKSNCSLLSNECVHQDESESEEELDKKFQKVQIASRYIVNEEAEDVPRRVHHWKVTPCVCEICKKYHELFHIRS